MLSTICHSKEETVKKRTLVEKVGTFANMVKEFKDELHPFAQHLFNKDWQNDQERILQRNLQVDEALGIFNFAERFPMRISKGGSVHVIHMSL